MAGRIFSIIFYMMIAVTTCLMAYKVTATDRVCFNDGYRTRQSFQNRLFLTGIFVVLFLCSALRFDIGHDYWKYTQIMHDIYYDEYVVTEAGFNIIVDVVFWLCNGECYELVFAIFAFATLLIFLKAFYKRSVEFGEAFFMFMTMGLYFQTYNTIRYYLALAIVVYTIRYVLNKDWIRFIFWILVAALFHKSVLLVLPVYWIATFRWKKLHIIVGLILSGVCFIGKGVILKLALMLYPSYEGTAQLYTNGIRGNLSSIMRVLVVLAFYVWFRKYKGDRFKELETRRELDFYMQLNLLAFVACTFFSFLPVVTRVAYYFSVTQIFMVPLIIKGIDDEKLRYRVKKIVFLICAAYFMIFLLQAHHDGVGLLPYNSWLFDLERYKYM